MLANKVGFESDNMVYKSWLFLKLDAMGEDGESLKLHLESKMPKDLTRTKKRKPGPDDPQGADKFNVCSDAWVNKHKKVQEKLDKKVKGPKGRGRTRKLDLEAEAEGDTAPPSLVASKVTKTKSGRQTAASFMDID